MGQSEPASSSPQIPTWTQPSHPGTIKVEQPSTDKASFSAYATAERPFSAGELITAITTATPASSKAYSSCQVSETEHIELNSDLLYCNHSCDPNIIFDMKNMEVRAVKDINAGDAITFFYPSSEWDMAQSFECNCGSERCLGVIKGAKYIPKDILGRYWLNEHIERMLEKRGD